MNIVITFKLSQLDTLIEVLLVQPINKPGLIAEKCLFYMYKDCFKKLKKKQIDKHHDFNGKSFKMLLNYTEATALYLQLIKIKQIDNVYSSHVVRWLKDTLHQQLINL